MLTSIVVLTAPLRAQTQGRWSIAYTYSGTSIALMNGSGSTQQWPAGGPASVPTVTFGAGAAVTVSMSGTITATLRWVDQNGTPIFDPPPPSEVFILQTAGANWTYGGEDVIANVTNEGISAGLPNGVITATTGPPNWSRAVSARKLSIVDGSSGTITLPVTLDAHLSFSCTAGFWGSSTAQVSYSVREVAPADCYDFSGYPSPPPQGSTPLAQEAATMLQGPLSDGTGYYTNGRAYTNQSVQHALEQLKKTAVFYVFGHGGVLFQSAQTFWNNGQWGYMVEKEYARQQIISSGVPPNRVVALDTLPAGALNHVLLAVFQGCYTGYYNATWGSPVHGVVAKGADCALGFTGTISDGDAQTWAYWFWKKLCEEAYSVGNSARYAGGKCTPASGLRAVKIEGNPAIRVAPARYR